MGDVKIKVGYSYTLEIDKTGDIHYHWTAIITDDNGPYTIEGDSQSGPLYALFDACKAIEQDVSQYHAFVKAKYRRELKSRGR